MLHFQKCSMVKWNISICNTIAYAEKNHGEKNHGEKNQRKLRTCFTSKFRLNWQDSYNFGVLSWVPIEAIVFIQNFAQLFKLYRTAMSKKFIVKIMLPSIKWEVTPKRETALQAKLRTYGPSVNKLKSMKGDREMWAVIKMKSQKHSYKIQCLLNTLLNSYQPELFHLYGWQSYD